jgi:hypothetical protein
MQSLPLSRQQNWAKSILGNCPGCFVGARYAVGCRWSSSPPGTNGRGCLSCGSCWDRAMARVGSSTVVMIRVLSMVSATCLNWELQSLSLL